MFFSAIGSGVDFPSNVDGSAIRNERIRGKIYVRVGWGKSPEGDILAPPQEQWKRITSDQYETLTLTYYCYCESKQVLE